MKRGDVESDIPAWRVAQGAVRAYGRGARPRRCGRGFAAWARNQSSILDFGMRSRNGRSGGRNRTRTCDPLVVIQVLYQLSYPPAKLSFPTGSLGPRDRSCVATARPFRSHRRWAHLDSNQGLTGYEPAALDR